LQGLLGVVLAAKIPDLASFFIADHARKQAHAVTRVEAADFGASLPEDRILGGNGQITDHVQNMAATNCITSHQRDHGFGHLADQPLHFQDIQARNAILANVATVSAHALIAARTKRLIARACEQYDSHIGIVFGALKGV
jgi:hypothetical protein